MPPCEQIGARRERLVASAGSYGRAQRQVSDHGSGGGEWEKGAEREIIGVIWSFPVSMVVVRIARTSTILREYYTDDFTRRCLLFNENGHKIQPLRLMPIINRGEHFLFTGAGTFARLQKLIYGDRHIKY
jgi:hypothetical protein